MHFTLDNVRAETVATATAMVLTGWLAGAVCLQNKFRVMDCGGQRADRNKWMQYFQVSARLEMLDD